MPQPPAAASRKIGLDLARALAIGLVLVSHFGGFAQVWAGRPVSYPVMMSGFFGVELFFALSGWLIGGLLLDVAARDPTLAGWGRFMLRRWLRTLPLYWLWVGVLAVWHAPPAAELARFVTATQNLAWPMPGDMWFAVSWSLTVEEWFYLLFSAALLGGVALIRRPGPVLAAVIGVFILAPMLARLGVPAAADWDTAIRKVALLRLDAIGSGVLAVTLVRRRHPLVARPWLPGALGLAMLAGVGALGTFWPNEPIAWLRVLGPTLTPLGFALTLPALAALPWLPAAGLIRAGAALAYPLYLVHYSVLEGVGRLHHGLAASCALGVAATLALAAALHRWVEQPILARRPPQDRRVKQPVLARRPPRDGGVEQPVLAGRPPQDRAQSKPRNPSA
jgi:peptidoglycan/LPS O-acetylase OafA/YrhL